MLVKIIVMDFSGGQMPLFTGLNVGVDQTQTGGMLVSLQQVVQARGKSCAGVMFYFEAIETGIENVKRMNVLQVPGRL